MQQSFNALKQSGQQAHATTVTDIQNAYNNLSTEVNSISGGTLGRNPPQVQGFVIVVSLADSNLAKPAGLPRLLGGPVGRNAAAAQLDRTLPLGPRL